MSCTFNSIREGNYAKEFIPHLNVGRAAATVGVMALAVAVTTVVVFKALGIALVGNLVAVVPFAIGVGGLISAGVCGAFACVKFSALAFGECISSLFSFPDVTVVIL